jgi:hypothetical protein
MVTQSHIHFGQVPGGVMVFFRSNLGNGPMGTQACPANGGTVSGTITPADVVAIAGQNVTAGDFDALTGQHPPPRRPCLCAPSPL